MKKTMVESGYMERIMGVLNDFFEGKRASYFIFGSSLRGGGFGDVDVGIEGDVSDMELANLRTKFEESSIPYSVDVVDFNNVSEEFRENVFNQDVLWIKR